MLLMHVMPVAIPSLGTEFKSPSPTRSLDKQTKKKTKDKIRRVYFSLSLSASFLLRRCPHLGRS